MKVIDKNNKVYLFVPYIILMLLYLRISIFRDVAILLLLFPLIVGVILDKKVPKRYLLIYGFLALHLCTALLHTVSVLSGIKIVLQDVIWVAPIFIFDVIENIEAEKRRVVCRTISLLMTLTLGYCMVRSYLYSLSNPYAIRSMANFDVTETPAGMPLAIGGGYPLIFSCIILAPYFICLWKNHRHDNNRIGFTSIIAFVFTMLLLISSNVTTAVLLAAAGSAWMISINRKSNNAIILAAVLLLLAIVAINPRALASIVDFVSVFFNSKSIIYIRLQEILPALSGNSNSSAFGDRLMLAERSFSTIINHPILGAGFYVGFNYNDLTKYVGHHSEWFDFLATYGVLNGGLFLSFLYISFKNLLMAPCFNKSKSFYVVLGILYVIIGFMDPVLSTNALMILFVYIPCTEYAIGGNENEETSVRNI
ncbi:O-antigen ligase family protein [Limosilactobacillus fermentum]|uniref:O-antigen ligase family protein n=1 Tax=Limosilactobacillus fermentum TaxID=1613 RepID=UPI0022A8D3F4|nr:O-antigen ligase family protein [Limosilactobacillus fermentum]MCZ2327704.1 O-antigen ligase family protein [Limosilactobacillus fermentum]